MKIKGTPNIKQVALHHTAVSREKQRIQLYAVNRYHQGKWNMKSELGWYGGYNFFCDVDGIVTQYRKIGEETVANVGHNCDVASRCDTISFCFAGNFNGELPNDKQINAFKKWMQEMQSRWQLKTVRHRDIQPSRTCAGELMTMDYINARLLGRVEYPDSEDAAKEKLISQLGSMMDMLRKLLLRLRNK